MNSVMYSSKTDDWATPQAFFDELNDEFCFNLDPCASEENHKCEMFFTRQQNGLSRDWGGLPRILQSAIRQRDRRVGGEMLSGGAQGKHPCGYAYSRPDRYKVFP